jgi:hypothetical protein
VPLAEQKSTICCWWEKNVETRVFVVLIAVMFARIFL